MVGESAFSTITDSNNKQSFALERFLFEGPVVNSLDPSNPMKLIQVLSGEKADGPPPIWLMRQAGRYLPEYRQTRARAKGFLDLCYNPELATEVTLQPIRRFGFDAAILFSDILVIPDAIGQEVRFEEGVGPLLGPFEPDLLTKLDTNKAASHLAPVIETVGRVREALPRHTALIGFCGAPWTVATYMIAGKGTTDQAPARELALGEPDRFGDLMDVLVTVSADYLIAQLKAGADAVQIFDSWAGILGDGQFDRWCIEPVAQLVDRVRAEVPDAKIVGFPRGAGRRYDDYRDLTGVDCVGLDWTVPIAQAGNLQAGGPVQGSLDPLRLVAGGRALEEGVDHILAGLGDGLLIFNLGHGIVPHTPIAHVEALVERVRDWK